MGVMHFLVRFPHYLSFGTGARSTHCSTTPPPFIFALHTSGPCNRATYQVKAIYQEVGDHLTEVVPEDVILLEVRRRSYWAVSSLNYPTCLVGPYIGAPASCLMKTTTTNFPSGSACQRQRASVHARRGLWAVPGCRQIKPVAVANVEEHEHCMQQTTS